jgi:hypothetical protein
MRVYEKTKFEIGGVKYYISKVLHLTTGSLSEVHFEQVHHPFTRFVRSGEKFLEKTRSIYTDEFFTRTDKLDMWLNAKPKTQQPHTSAGYLQNITGII